MNKLQVMITPKETALVRKTAARIYHRYAPAGDAGELSKEEFYHYGIIGLLEAKKRFDPSKGVPWLAFAAKRVTGAMLDQLRRQPAIRLPQGAYQKVKALKEAKTALLRDGLNVHGKALANRLGWSVAEVHRVSAMIPTLVPADGASTESDDQRGGPMVLRVPGESPEEGAMRRDAAELVNRCLEALPSARDRMVIVSRVLDGLKLREVAETLGCSLESVRQRQKRVAEMMRICMENHGWSMVE
jgi:RNA polymerase sigma factor for flagellar operon FliA